MVNMRGEKTPWRTPALFICPLKEWCLLLREKMASASSFHESSQAEAPMLLAHLSKSQVVTSCENCLVGKSQTHEPLCHLALQSRLFTARAPLNLLMLLTYFLHHLYNLFILVITSLSWEHAELVVQSDQVTKCSKYFRFDYNNW